MTGEKVLVFGIFLAFWTISTCQGVAQDRAEVATNDFIRHGILANQNRISHDDDNEAEDDQVRLVLSISYIKSLSNI